MKTSGSVKPKTNIKNDLCKIKRRRLPCFVEKIINFSILNNYARLNGAILSVTLMLLVLSISALGFGIIGLASGDVIHVTPQLLETASNDGRHNVTVTWNFPYDSYTIESYNLLISLNGNKVVSNPYTVGDTKKGEHIHLVGSYVWNVPKDTPEGTYKVDLQIRTKESGIVNGGVYWLFGIAKWQGTLIVLKYEDLNGNGIRDPDEKGLAGWQFQIISPNNDIYTYATNETGYITISNAAVGNYKIMEIPQPGYNITEKTENAYVPNNKTGFAKFGNYREPPATLKIVKFEDKNRNKQMDSGETTIPRWEFKVEGPNPFTDKTNNDGAIVRNVTAGTYAIKESPQKGWISTTETEKSLTLKPGESQTVYFGNQRPQNIIKFHDLNANGIMDAGEPSLAGWTFEIEGPETTSRTTDANGQISINDLSTGTYTVTETLNSSEWYNTTPLSVLVSVPGPDVYFGNDMYRTLRAFKFNDSNNNSIFDQNEGALAGWEFQISGQEDGAVTNNKGIANFNVKANREYLVSETLVSRLIREGWQNTTPREARVLIDPTKNATEVRFGNHLIPPKPILPPILRIVAFNDSNDNGRRDPGEKVLPNIVFRLSNSDQTFVPIEQRTTNGAGTVEYICPSFSNYTVEEILPAYWCASTPVIETMWMKMGDNKTLEFGIHLCIHANCEYRYTPEKTNMTLRVEDENLIVRKSVDPWVLTPSDHNMTNGGLINYTISVSAKPKIGPTDLILAVDSSGSIIEGNDNALANIDGGITSFVEAMKSSRSSSLRIGLVSWDSNIDETVSPTTSYDDVINASHKLKANPQELTMYPVGMNGSLTAFNAAPREGDKKVIVFITDARNEYEPFQALPDQKKFTINVLLMGKPQVNETYQMLGDLVNKYNGHLYEVNTPTDIVSALNEVAANSLLANGEVNDIEIKDTLPSYLRPLTNGTKQGNVTKNMDGIGWTTTTLNWKVPALKYGDSWSTTFRTVFCWKLQANVVQSENGKADTSQVTYSNTTNGDRRSLKLPEGTIWLENEPTDIVSSGNGPEPVTKKVTPGFEVLFALVGLAAGGYLIRGKKGGV